MEENIHDDKLDDYVRKSFEGHEEDPSADMWSRVEADLLPPAAVPAPRASYLRYGWQALAAMVILILLSMLVCEHLYYEEKIRVLTAKPAEEHKNESTDPPTGQAIHETSNPKSLTQSLHALESTTTIPPSPGATNLQGSALPNVKKSVRRKSLVLPAEKTEGKEEHFMSFRSNTPASQKTLHLISNTNSNSVPGGDSIRETASYQTLAESNTQNFQKRMDITWMTIPSSLIKSPMPSYPQLSLLPIKPMRESSGWYVGLQTSLLSQIEKEQTPKARPGRPAFSSQQENPGIIFNHWLKVGKKLGPRFSLETGIGYQNTTRTATHTPRFRFGDGTHQGQITRRTYQYDLSTSGGTAEVSLRMEQTNPGPPTSDDEPVSLKITTSQHTQLLRIPLLASYQIGSRKLHGQLKAGLLGNLVLKNELDISARVSQNARFQPVSGRDGYTVKLNQGKFFLGYWLSAETEFDLNQQISLVAGTSLMGDFPRNDSYRRRLPKSYLVGINLGLNYNF